MKSLILRVLPCLFVAVSSTAFTAPITYEAVYRAELTSKTSKAYTGGSLSVDGRTGVVSLTLQPVMPACGEGMVCAQRMPEPIEYTLENAKTEEDHCGIIRTKASFDQRPVDGIFLQVTINNNGNNTCPTLVALPALDLIVEQKYYDRLKGTEVRRVDTFQADDVALINPGPKNPPVTLFEGKILGALYNSPNLDLKLQYAGGCKDHAFELQWGDCKRVKALNSYIKECSVSLVHAKGADDSCEALITKTHTIDLSHLGAAYIINLNGTRVLVH